MYRIFLVIFVFLLRVASCNPTFEKNEKIFSEVIEERLQKQEDISSFFQNIDEVGKEALQKGLDLSCYNFVNDSETGLLSYQSHILWEGNEKVDLIFFLLVWPAEEEAIKRNPDNTWYKTNIHSHPIPCAYTVMQNGITERRFALLEGTERKVAFREKEVLYPGAKAVDLNQAQDLFIHQLLFEGDADQPAITLHVYKAPSIEKYFHILTENPQHRYPDP